MDKLNQFIMEGKLEIIADPVSEENDCLVLSYYIKNYGSGVNECYSTIISNADRYVQYKEKNVRIVGKLFGNELFVEHLEVLD